MPDLTGTDVAANYEQYVPSNGLGGRTIIATVVGNDDTNITESELVAATQGIANAGGDGTGSDTDGPDAFTVAGMVGTADGASGAVYVALQGTGTLGTTKADYATGVTFAAVATFDQ